MPVLKIKKDGKWIEISGAGVSSWNDLKDRPFWEEKKVIEIIPEMTVTTVFDDNIGVTYAQLTNTPKLTVGQAYTVIFNGTSYECIGRQFGGHTLLGNGTIYGDGLEGNGEPFCINSWDNSEIYLIAAEGEYTISILADEVIVHKLDNKYLDLPTNLATTDDVEEAKDAVDAKMDADNPVGTGSFSMNRKGGTQIGNYSHAEGYQSEASGTASHAEGYYTVASEYGSHAEGVYTKATGKGSHAEGSNVDSDGASFLNKSIKLPNGSTVTISASTAAANNAHAEGAQTYAGGFASHTEGYWTVAHGSASHAEGHNTKATGEGSHAEGYQTTASEKGSHAEGGYTKASGVFSHAEGYETEASGHSAHAEGFEVKASSDYQHVQGKFNIEDAESKYAHIVGNGKAEELSNAHTLDWSGNAWFAGDVYVGGTGQDDEVAERLAKISDIPSTEGLATESYVNSAVASLVNAAPEALNTLDELAAALGDDSNFATTIATEIGKKVDKVDGKGLSTNDFTDELKSKLENISDTPKTATYSVTIPNSSWTSYGTGFKNTVSVPGIAVDDEILIDVQLTGTESSVADDIQLCEQWCKIYRASVLQNNELTVFANEVPTVSIPVKIKVVG